MIVQFDPEEAAKMSKPDVLIRAYEDPVFFANYFLKQSFNLDADIPFFHRAMLAIMTRKVEFLEQYGEVDKILKHFPNQFKMEKGKLILKYAKHTLLILPRGFGKTIMTKIFIIWSMLFRKKKTILFISESSTHSEAQCRDIRGILESNEIIIEYFGKQSPERNQSGGKRKRSWKDEEIETPSGTSLITRGRNGQIRGTARAGNTRPDLIVLDDVEDEQSVATEEQRIKCKQWFFAAVKPALLKKDPSSMIIACGTILHR